MGRWSQRIRRGGGGPTLPAGIVPGVITSVTVGSLGFGQLLVTFSTPIFVVNFDPAFFADTTQGDPADSVAQVSGNVLVYQAAAWIGAIAAGDTWLFADAGSGAPQPQTGLVT